jgi:hypothetical protein
MNSLEIIKYFADKRMGSYMLSVVDVIWEVLDEIEKQMVKTLSVNKSCTLLLKSTLSQEELDKQISETLFVTL